MAPEMPRPGGPKEPGADLPVELTQEYQAPQLEPEEQPVSELVEAAQEAEEMGKKRGDEEVFDLPEDPAKTQDLSEQPAILPVESEPEPEDKPAFELYDDPEVLPAADVGFQLAQRPEATPAAVLETTSHNFDHHTPTAPVSTSVVWNSSDTNFYT